MAIFYVNSKQIIFAAIAMLEPISLQVVTYQDATDAIHIIRSTVFQIEQGVDPEIEFDGQDADAIHLLAYEGTQPIGTTRIRYLNAHLAKIERVAVLPAYRGRGIGRQLMEKAICWIQKQGCHEVKINAQIHAKQFYEKLGFQAQGFEFEEAGIPHIEMRRKFIHPCPQSAIASREA